MSTLLLPKPTRTLPAERKRIGALSSRESARDRETANQLCAKLVKERANWSCEAFKFAEIRCSQMIDCAHGFAKKRASRAVRWSHLGTFSLCRNHHRYFGEHDTIWQAWMYRKLGAEAFERLRVMANSEAKVDIKDVIADLRRGRTQAERS